MTESKDFSMFKVSDASLFHSEYQEDNKSQHFKYDNPLFYCAAKSSCYDEESDVYIPEHWHKNLEFLFVIKGSINYEVEGKKIVIHEKEGIMVNPCRIHSNNSPKGESVIFYFCEIDPSYVSASPYIYQKFVEPMMGAKSFDYLLLTELDWTRDLLKELNHIFKCEQSDEMELEIIESSYRMMKIIHRNMKEIITSNEVSSAYETNYNAMIDYIKSNYGEKISLEDIAQAGNVGKTLCAKLFKTFSSQTPGDYLIHYRVTQSMDLLKKGELSITDIAYRVGFNSPSHFTKTFREITGNTPKKYAMNQLRRRGING